MPKQKSRPCLEVCEEYSGFVTGKLDRSKDKMLFKPIDSCIPPLFRERSLKVEAEDGQKTESLKQSPFSWLLARNHPSGRTGPSKTAG